MATRHLSYTPQQTRKALTYNLRTHTLKTVCVVQLDGSPVSVGRCDLSNYGRLAARLPGSGQRSVWEDRRLLPR